MKHAREWWGAPGYRVPTVRQHGKETSDSMRRTSRAWCKRKQLKQHMLSFHGRRLGLYLRGVRFETDQVRYEVEAVDVLGRVIVEVVVRVRFGEVLDESKSSGRR